MQVLQSARDLMAEELRCGRPIPLAWQVQVADEERKVLLTLPFARLVFSEVIAAQISGMSRAIPPEAHLALIEPAKATFLRARKSNGDIKKSLTELRSHLRRLGRLSSALGNGSA